MKKQISFVGAGRMAEALIRGLISTKTVSPKSILASDKDPARLKHLNLSFEIKTAADNIKAAYLGEVVILSVKPQAISEVLREIGPVLRSHQLLISIAAGIRLDYLEKFMKNTPVVRVMPNSPCQVLEGMSALCKGRNASEKDLRVAEQIFSAVGKTVVVEEKYINAITALSGSGPAFIYETLEALIDGGVKAGLPRSLAEQLALQTGLGALKTVGETGKSLDKLVQMVASPGGTTQAGLKVLEEGKLKALLISAVVAAAKRAKELSEEFEK